MSARVASSGPSVWFPTVNTKEDREVRFVDDTHGLSGTLLLPAAKYTSAQATDIATQVYAILESFNSMRGRLT